MAASHLAGARGVRQGRVGLPDGGPPRAQLEEIQRQRLMAGAVSAISELGYAGTTVGDITGRARVSRRTFYEMFAGREECVAAVLEDMVERVRRELAGAGLEGRPWRERVREGLFVILSFLEREPALARVCVVQAPAGARVLERRDEVLATLAEVVDEGRLESARGAGCTQLVAEGLVGAAYMIVQSRLRGEPGSLTGLLGELMGMIVLPYLGPAAAHSERARPARSASVSPPRPLPLADVDPLHGVPMRLTYRTARVLEGVREHPGASNRRVAEHAGIVDPGQVSKLLRRLEQLGLLQNRGGGHAQGEPNAWRLTHRGEQVAHSISQHSTRRAA